MNKPLIMIIDDEPDFIEILKMALIDDFVLECFTNPHQAIASASSPNIKLILTDLTMPEMNGVDVVKGIRAVNRLVPILLVTGLSRNDEEVLCALKAGGTDVFEKPIRNLKSIQEATRRLTTI